MIEHDSLEAIIGEKGVQVVQASGLGHIPRVLVQS